MGPTPSEARYIREHHFNDWNPHPQAQTVYTYPLGPTAVSVPMSLCSLVVLICSFVDNAPVVIAYILLAFEIVFIVTLVLIHPAVGIRQRAFLEIPEDGSGKVEVSIRRPLFGRRSCEVKFGVSGTDPYTEYVSRWTRRRYRVRREPALWVVGW